MACHIDVEVFCKWTDKKGVGLELYPCGRTIFGPYQVEASAGGQSRQA